MCGRYAQVSVIEELTQRYKPTVFHNSEGLKPTYNAAPTQVMPVLYQNTRQEMVLAGMTWGLTPGWSASAQNKASTINAQQETAAQKPTFRHLVQTNRCLVPISAFYEWQLKGNVKQPYALLPPDGAALLGGLWDTWQDAEGNAMQSFTILTTPATGLMGKLHHRQPVWVLPEHETQWLDLTQPWPMLENILAPFAWQGWQARTVSARVNSVKVNDPTLLQEVAPIPVQGSLF